MTDLVISGLEELDSVYASPSDFQRSRHRERVKGKALIETFVKQCHDAQVFSPQEDSTVHSQLFQIAYSPYIPRISHVVFKSDWTTTTYQIVTTY